MPFGRLSPRGHCVPPPPSSTAGPEATGHQPHQWTHTLQCLLPTAGTQPLWIQLASGIWGQFHGRRTHGSFNSVRTCGHSSDSLGKNEAEMTGQRPVVSACLSVCTVTSVLVTHADLLSFPRLHPFTCPPPQMSLVSPETTATKWIMYQTLLRVCSDGRGWTGHRAGSCLEPAADATVGIVHGLSPAGSSSAATFSLESWSLASSTFSLPASCLRQFRSLGLLDSFCLHPQP